MTDEEMAVEYCNNEVPFDITESGEKLYTETDLKQAFLAGLKAGKDMEEADLATVAYMQGASRNKAKLDEAKEIIKKLVEGIRIISDPKVELTDVDVFVAKAEAFLKESGE